MLAGGLVSTCPPFRLGFWTLEPCSWRSGLVGVSISLCNAGGPPSGSR